MRFTLALLGHTLDISLEPTTADEQDPAAGLDGGTLGSAGPISFAPQVGTPAEWVPPDRTIPWEPEDR